MEIVIIAFLSHFSCHFSQSPIFKRPLDGQTGITGTISVTNIKIQLLIHSQGQHSSFGMIPFHRLERFLLIPLPCQSFLESTRDKWSCRTSRHDIRITTGTRSAGKQISIHIVFQQRSRKIIQYRRISQSPERIQVPLCQPKRIGVIHMMFHLPFPVLSQLPYMETNIFRLCPYPGTIRIIRIFTVIIIQLMPSQ